MTNSELARLNELRTAEGLAPFANPRNATAGSLKLLDPKLCGQRRLRFVAHGLGEVRGPRRRLVLRDPRSAEDVGASRSARTTPRFDDDRRGDRARRRLGVEAARAGLPDRRPGHQGRRPRPAGAARPALQEPALGDRLQVRGRAGDHEGPGDHRPGRQDRQADARSPSWSRSRWPGRPSGGPACTTPTRSTARTSGSATRSSSRRPARSSRRSSASRPTPATARSAPMRSPTTARAARPRSIAVAGTRSISAARIRRRGAPSSSRSGSAGSPTATRWTSTASARS